MTFQFFNFETNCSKDETLQECIGQQQLPPEYESELNETIAKVQKERETLQSELQGPISEPNQIVEEMEVVAAHQAPGEIRDIQDAKDCCHDEEINHVKPKAAMTKADQTC